MLTPTGSPDGSTTGSSLVGSVIAGKYRLRRLIGHGGMGSVYKAENLTIGRTVALKILHAHLADDGTTLARFQREARLAASAGHDHVVEILDMGVEPSGAPYIVMEYVRGQSLAQAIRDGAMGASRAARIAGEILAALSAVHARGIVHRDLKPENVMLTTRAGRTDFVKLHDFGISTFVEAVQDPQGPTDLTPSGRTMGTPHYASPEQIQGARGRDARVDIYAVGVMLFEMLSGHRPFVRENFPALCKAIVGDDPPPLSAFRKDVPEGLEAAMRRAMNKSPDDRFADAAQMRLALVPFGAAPPAEEPEPTDTFTLDMRELAAREEELRASSEDGVPPPGTSEAVRGEVLETLLDYVRDRVGGPRYERLLDETDPAVARAVRSGLEPGAWYPIDAIAILEVADREYASGDRRLIAEAGRALARKMIGKNAPNALVRTVTPELFFSMAADLHRRFFSTGIPVVVRAVRGHGRFEVRESGNGSLARVVVVMGLVDQALRLSGARDVDVRLVSATALGDEADIVEATWAS